MIYECTKTGKNGLTDNLERITEILIGDLKCVTTCINTDKGAPAEMILLCTLLLAAIPFC
jgi:hypothetical protein